MRRRVLYVMHGLECGGGERTLYRWATNLPRHYMPAVAAIYRNGSVREELCRAGVPAQYIWLTNPDERARQEAYAHLQQTMELADIVHTFTGQPEVEESMTLAAQAGVKVRVQSVGWLYTPPPDHVTHRVLESKWLMDECTKAHPQIPCRFLPVPIDVPEEVPHRPVRKPVIGRLGRLDMNKGLDDFIETASRIHAVDSGPQFVVYGDGPAREPAEKQAAALGVPVEFRGATSDPGAAYAAMDIFFYPTRGDSTAVVNLEAMAHGLPVVTRPIGNIAEYVEHGVNGYLEDTAETAIPRLLELVASYELRDDVGGMGREYVRTHHDSAVVGAKMAEYYDEMLGV